MEFALFRSQDAVHVLVHHRIGAPTVIQTSFGPWAPLGWIDSRELDEPLRQQVLDDLATNAYAVIPADNAPDIARRAARHRSH